MSGDTGANPRIAYHELAYGQLLAQTEAAIELVARHLSSRRRDGPTPLQKLLQLEMAELRGCAEENAPAPGPADPHLPRELDGTTGTNRAPRERCVIAARDDYRGDSDYAWAATYLKQGSRALSPPG